MTTDTKTEFSFDIRPAHDIIPADQRAEILAMPGFGQTFTDNMVRIRWTEGRGWHDARLEPYGPLTLDPATSVFHYGQENDREWVPADEGKSLYLRPFMIATHRGLGVNSPASSFEFLVIASPSATYFSGSTVTVWLTEDYTRAAPGGTGEAKCGGNYAAGFIGQLQAVENGCDQVVWLDAAERRFVEEMGGMNLFFCYQADAQARLVTPALTGSLLPGITRDSLLKLAPEMGIPTEEGRISVSQWRSESESGELTEAFACGTAAVITPVGRVKSAHGDWVVGDGQPGPVTMRLRDELLGIQYGRRPDPYGWIHKIC